LAALLVATVAIVLTLLVVAVVRRRQVATVRPVLVAPAETEQTLQDLFLERRQFVQAAAAVGVIVQAAQQAQAAQAPAVALQVAQQQPTQVQAAAAV
jgi:shikimate kinase